MSYTVDIFEPQDFKWNGCWKLSSFQALFLQGGQGPWGIQRAPVWLVGGTLASRTGYVSAHSPSRVQLFATIWTVARQVPLSMRFPRQECWSGLLFPSPGGLPNPGIEPTSPASLALQLNSLVLCRLDTVTCTGYSHFDFDIWKTRGQPVSHTNNSPLQQTKCFCSCFPFWSSKVDSIVWEPGTCVPKFRRAFKPCLEATTTWPSMEIRLNLTKMKIFRFGSLVYPRGLQFKKWGQSVDIFWSQEAHTYYKLWVTHLPTASSVFPEPLVLLASLQENHFLWMSAPCLPLVLVTIFPAALLQGSHY